ncbi:DUF4288 domain-containing protein [Planococcus sp. 1R117A]|uniref:DUF4288 domain-containing protein n=1 Tax=Planococcus sp. 1R117A TaxID=3447020 RepID=UPI003EDB85E3
MRKRLRKKMSKDWEWYAVKVLYECIISGDPASETLDRNYSNTEKTFEESILLIKASSFDQAYDLAEKEAKQHEIDYLNPYDEKVVWKFVESIDCFQMFDRKLQIGTELYSRLLHVPKGITNEQVIAQYYPETVVEELVDKNFILRNKDFNARPNFD